MRPGRWHTIGHTAPLHAQREYGLPGHWSGNSYVIIYRDIWWRQTPRTKLARLAALAARKDALGFLVESGELEQGLLNAVYPEQDGWSARHVLLRQAALAAGYAFCTALDGLPVEPHFIRALGVLERLDRAAWPDHIRIKPPEGYVHYALDPAGYAVAARAWRDVAGGQQAARAVVGVRGIGTSLSAAVAVALGPARPLTVRPRGRSGDRHIPIDPALDARVRSWLRDGSDVPVVDEGPGATRRQGILQAVARSTRWITATRCVCPVLPTGIGPGRCGRRARAERWCAGGARAAVRGRHRRGCG